MCVAGSPDLPRYAGCTTRPFAKLVTGYEGQGFVCLGSMSSTVLSRCVRHNKQTLKMSQCHTCELNESQTVLQ